MLPSDPQARTVINKRVLECVKLLNEIEGIKEDVKALGVACKDDYKMPTSDFTNIVNAAYNREKVEQQVEKLQTSLAEADILSK
jgi:uncharacterized protein (DUF1810 family)